MLKLFRKKKKGATKVNYHHPAFFSPYRHAGNAAPASPKAAI